MYSQYYRCVDFHLTEEGEEKRKEEKEFSFSFKKTKKKQKQLWPINCENYTHASLHTLIITPSLC